MLGWIPFLGPIINGVIGIFNKAEDTAVQFGAQKTELAIEQGNQDVAVLNTRAQVAIAFKDDPGVKFVRDMVMGCVGMWIGLVFWDSCFRNLMPDYTWRVLALPEEMKYIPYMVMAFLFVSQFRGPK